MDIPLLLAAAWFSGTRGRDLEADAWTRWLEASASLRSWTQSVRTIRRDVGQREAEYPELYRAFKAVELSCERRTLETLEALAAPGPSEAPPSFEAILSGLRGAVTAQAAQVHATDLERLARASVEALRALGLEPSS